MVEPASMYDYPDDNALEAAYHDEREKLMDRYYRLNDGDLKSCVRVDQFIADASSRAKGPFGNILSIVASHYLRRIHFQANLGRCPTGNHQNGDAAIEMGVNPITIASMVTGKI
jgi:hypothetical protein